MIIYNVTINVEEEIHADWIVWMKEVHIPEVMNTGVFIENKICKVLSTTEDETGHTYAVQYTCLSMEDLENYQKNHAPRLQKEHLDRYQGKFVAFRTLLEVI
ncbi:MAG: hypothetical protein A3K10_17090 [Bacteroidetes bacterium RIFCSPLOWO2_12_FULL_31_6]|nr:MAG: hypothetical protein A3K10_17090 [Bacteroidetes bacterium RIFCSPLOWO2_12_FULL_31_6]